MVRNFVLALGVISLAAPVAAASKKVDCGHQAAVVGAVQKARQERVRERKVQEHVLAGEVTWPERYNTMIPLVTPWVYEQKRKDIAEKDLAAVWQELCVAN